MDGAAKPSAEGAGPGFWRRLRARLRFGLGGLVLFVLFLGSLAAVWVRWEAWVYVGPYNSGKQLESVVSDVGKLIMNPQLNRDHSAMLKIRGDSLIVTELSNLGKEDEFKPFGNFNIGIETEWAQSKSWWSKVGPLDQEKILNDFATRIIPEVSEHFAVLTRRGEYILFNYRDGSRLATIRNHAVVNAVDEAVITQGEEKVFLLGNRLTCWDLQARTPVFEIPLRIDHLNFKTEVTDRIIVHEFFRSCPTILDAKSGELLFTFNEIAVGKFKDKDSIILYKTSDGESKEELWHRHRPEWWWGHLYRLEVWIAIVLGGLWLWRAVRAFRSPCSP